MHNIGKVWGSNPSQKKNQYKKDATTQ